MSEIVRFPAGFPRARKASAAKLARDACEAVLAVGGTVASVEISPEGGVRVLTTAASVAALTAGAANEWDDVLPR